MFAGPILHREALTLPRQVRHYLLRSGYQLALFVLMYTAGQTTFFRQSVSTIGEIARFGSLIFALFAVTQLALVLFFAPLLAASRIAQEKDRQTLILLLMTDLRDREMVLGRLLASLLSVAVLIGLSAPVLTLVMLLGGVSIQQVGWLLALTLAAGLAAGSWGTLVAFWREKTFQTLAISVIGIMLFIGLIELLAALSPPAIGSAFTYGNPFRGLALVLDPMGMQPHLANGSVGAGAYVVTLLVLAGVLDLIATVRLRVWNPPRIAYDSATLNPDKSSAPSRIRTIWNTPVIWREICTRAYGRKMVLIKLAYLVLFGIAMGYVWQTQQLETSDVMGLVRPEGAAFIVLGFLSLLLVNAQAVTALTTEKDAKTLELLLVTDISAQEFILGKLGGIFYNTKEVLILPLLALGWYVSQGVLTLEDGIYVLIGFLVLVAFAAMLGVHAGIAFDSSRLAIANSLGTMFFLFLGIFICMLLIMEARTSFAMQLPSFLVFILGGSIGLWASLTHKNPSPALALAAFLLPFLTFYSIVSFLLGSTLGICVVMTLTYGFTTLAMLIPAISEFDIALGRSSADASG